MIRFDQKVLHDPDKGIRGDCFPACLRCILENETVPHFMEHDDWLDRLSQYLSSRDLCFVEIYPQAETASRLGWHIITGPSPRFRNEDLLHCVVGLSGQPVFDPHPSRAFLAPGDVTYGLLVRKLIW